MLPGTPGGHRAAEAAVICGDAILEGSGLGSGNGPDLGDGVIGLGLYEAAVEGGKGHVQEEEAGGALLVARGGWDGGVGVHLVGLRGFSRSR